MRSGGYFLYFGRNRMHHHFFTQHKELDVQDKQRYRIKHFQS